MEFIFGTLSTDELKLVHHRARRTGLQHGHARQPRKAVPNEPVKLWATTGPDFEASHVVAYTTTGQTFPVGNYGRATQGQVIHFERGEVVWDTHLWGYIQTWTAELPAQPANTVVRYSVGAWADGQAEIFADSPNPTHVAESAASAFFKQQEWSLADHDFAPTQPKIFTYRVDNYHVPQWAHASRIYHIFVDRFNPGQGRDWHQTSDLMKFCGGTLDGITEKLDYIEALNINCLWLSPTWVSPSHHGYDALDYQKTEARLGGDEALRRLIGEAHARDMRVLLDLPCNHMSNEHDIFQLAINDSTSAYRDWFTFDDSAHGYRSFFGVATLPELNLANPDTRDWMIDNALYWLKEFEIDGYRLDYANGPGPEFWTDFMVACKQENPECYCFGEVVDAPEMMQPYIGILDGCLDFHLGDAMRRTFGWQTMSLADLQTFKERQLAYFAHPDFVMPTFLDNHDMDRITLLAEGDMSIVRAAAEFQMNLPGPPIVYYGTEVGLSQSKSVSSGGLHLSRTPMIWNEVEQDTELLAFYQDLLAQRATKFA